MIKKFSALAFLILFLSGCYNRYKAPPFWQNLPYPFVQSGLQNLPCKVYKDLQIEIIDRRKENDEKKVGDTEFRSDLIQDNVLTNLPYFLTDRFCTYFQTIGIGCIADDRPSNSGKLQILVKTITPDIRGSLWGRARGLVEIKANLISKKDTIFSRDYIAIAQDGDPDVPIEKYSALTIELGGKLVTATSLKRVADSLSVDLCRNIGQLEPSKGNEI